MCQRLQVPLLIVGILIAGCERKLPTPQTPSTAGHRWGEPYDWLNDPPAVRAVDFSAMSIDNLALRDTVMHWESVASRMHDERWFHHEWYSYGPGKSALQWWSSTPGYVSPEGKIGSPQSKSGSLHLVRIACVSNTSIQKPEFATLTAVWMPKRDGWGVHFYTMSRGAGDGHVHLWFYPRRIGGDRSLFNFYPGLARWEYRVTFEQANYVFQVALPDAAFDGGGMSAPFRFDRLRDWCRTTESFRSAGLEMLNRLEQEMKMQIPAGNATKQVFVTIVEGGEHGGDPPRYYEQPIERSLRSDEIELVMDAARQEVSRRRTLLQDHFRAMHMAMQNVFPMTDVTLP